MAYGCQGHFAMFHTLGPNQIIRQFLDGRCPAAHGYDLNAVVVIQMAVERGDDVLTVVVLMHEFRIDGGTKPGYRIFPLFRHGLSAM